MAKRLIAILYSFTALATLIVGLTSFDSMCAVLSPINQGRLVSFAVLDFAVPTVFLLAGISAIWTNDKSRAPRWICAAGVLIFLLVVFIHHGLRWRIFLEATGALISVVFILGSSVRQASTMVGLGAVIYAIFQGPDLVLSFHRYWAFGDTLLHLLGTTMPPLLVTASIAVAIYSHLRIRAKMTRVGSLP